MNSHVAKGNAPHWTPHTGYQENEPSRWTRPYSIITRVYVGENSKVEFCWTAHIGERYATGFCDDLETAQKQAETWIALVWAVVKAGER